MFFKFFVHFQFSEKNRQNIEYRVHWTPPDRARSTLDQPDTITFFENFDVRRTHAKTCEHLKNAKPSKVEGTQRGEVVVRCGEVRSVGGMRSAR